MDIYFIPAALRANTALSFRFPGILELVYRYFAELLGKRTAHRKALSTQVNTDKM
jgi:hypothetical protein